MPQRAYIAAYQISATRQRVLDRMLAEKGVEIANLPPAMQTACTFSDRDVAQAALIALFTGCVVTQLEIKHGGYDWRLEVRTAQKPPECPRQVWIRAERGACEREMRSVLRRKGLQPPRQRSMTFFSQINL